MIQMDIRRYHTAIFDGVTDYPNNVGIPLKFTEFLEDIERNGGKIIKIFRRSRNNSCSYDGTCVVVLYEKKNPRVNYDNYTILCPDCKNEVDCVSVFCPYCGINIEQRYNELEKAELQSKKHLFCINCYHEEYSNEHKFCKFCGGRLVRYKKLFDNICKK